MKTAAQTRSPPRRDLNIQPLSNAGGAGSMTGENTRLSFDFSFPHLFFPWFQVLRQYDVSAMFVTCSPLVDFFVPSFIQFLFHNSLS